MPNKNYVKGRMKEYSIKKGLELQGYTVLRTAGSHGFADLIAINKEKQIIRFIQCKPDNFPSKKEADLLGKYNIYNDFSIIWRTTFEVI